MHPFLAAVALKVFFSAGPAGPAASCRLEILTPKVERFGKARFLISFSATYTNPFDPGEIAVDLEILTPSGKQIRWPAFFHQAYEVRYVGKGRRGGLQWIYPAGNPTWRARFSPREPGRYKCLARVRTQNLTVRSRPVSFLCVPSRRKGFVQVVRRNGRFKSSFLSFSDGTPFFALGHNLAFLGYGQYLGSLEKIRQVFGKMTANGANFTRIWAGAGDWALAVEWHKSCWSRSWQRSSPVVPAPGLKGKRCVNIQGGTGTSKRFFPCAPIALKPETRYRLSCMYLTAPGTGLKIELNGRIFELKPSAGWRRFEKVFKTESGEWFVRRINLSLTADGGVWLRDLSLKEDPAGPDLLGEAKVNRPELGWYSLYDSFLLDKVIEAAESSGLYLQLCLLSNPVRDLYMKRLRDPGSAEYAEAVRYAKRAFRYAVARWGASSALAVWEFFNEMNPGLPTDRFYREVGEAIARMDIYRRPVTTSAWHSNPRDWRHPQLNIAQEHYYLRPGRKSGVWKDEVAAVLDRVTLLRKNTPSGKPFMIGEFGLATERWGRNSAMARDRGLLHFHNALWASALSGSAGTALFWWWETLDGMNAYRHYKPLSRFLKEVPFTRSDLGPARAAASSNQVHVVGLQRKDCAFLWICNKEACWYSRLVEGRKVSPVEGLKIRLSGLKGGRYSVRWWDTFKGEVIAEDSCAAEAGGAVLKPPRFTTDIACTIKP